VKKYVVAIVGATGAVGGELLKVLAEREFPVGELRLLATERSCGKKISFRGREYVVEATTADSFAGVDLAFFAGGPASLLYAREAAAKGVTVIDNSSAFRYDDEVPLVVPEVNPEDVLWHKGIIANPNCSTIQMLVALKPLYDFAGIKRISVSTYQAVSGAGAEALAELENQVSQLSAGEEPQINVFPYQIAFNLIPRIDAVLPNGYTKEEMKLLWETRKIFHDDKIAVSATAVRVPVYRSHSEAVSIETERPLSPQKARELLEKAPGVVVVDDPENNKYPMPLFASDTDEVYVGRIRQDIALENGLLLWVVADQIRKGAATNAVQIAELLLEKELL